MLCILGYVYFIAFLSTNFAYELNFILKNEQNLSLKKPKHKFWALFLPLTGSVPVTMIQFKQTLKICFMSMSVVFHSAEE